MPYPETDGVFLLCANTLYRLRKYITVNYIHGWWYDATSRLWSTGCILDR